MVFSLNSESACKLKKRIPGSRLLTSSLPGSVLRTHVESLGKPRDVNNRQQSFSKPCLVNLVSPSIDFARGSESCAYSIYSHDSH